MLILSLFLFFLQLAITTEAMGIWRFAGAFAVVKRQSECGSKTAGMHVNQPMNIGVCYAFGVWLYILLFSHFIDILTETASPILFVFIVQTLL
jgi:hypothetical protein